MREYKRLTISGGEISFYDYAYNKCSNRNLPHIRKQLDEGLRCCDIEDYRSKTYTTDELKAIYSQLSKLEDEIENGTHVKLKYGKGDMVYVIYYVTGEIKTCECCGQEYEPECTPHKVIKGIVVARNYIDPDERIREEGGISYKILTKSNGELNWYVDRPEEDVFKTEEEAELKLAELKGGK